MPRQRSLKRRIEDLHDADVLTPELYQGLRRAAQRHEDPIRQIFSQLEITALEFFGQNRLLLECIIWGHDWHKGAFGWEYIPCGKPVVEDCLRCSESKTTTTDSLGKVLSRYHPEAKRPKGKVPFPRTMTKWERDTLQSYTLLIDHVALLEEGKMPRERPARPAALRSRERGGLRIVV